MSIGSAAGGSMIRSAAYIELEADQLRIGAGPQRRLAGRPDRRLAIGRRLALAEVDGLGEVVLDERLRQARRERRNVAGAIDLIGADEAHHVGAPAGAAELGCEHRLPPAAAIAGDGVAIAAGRRG